MPALALVLMNRLEYLWRSQFVSQVHKICLTFGHTKSIAGKHLPQSHHCNNALSRNCHGSQLAKSWESRCFLDHCRGKTSPGRDIVYPEVWGKLAHTLVWTSVKLKWENNRKKMNKFRSCFLEKSIMLMNFYSDWPKKNRSTRNCYYQQLKKGHY